MSADLYLDQLRKKLIRVLSVLTIVFILLSFFAKYLYQFFALPLLSQLPSKTLLATSLTAPVFTPLKLAFLCSIVITAPYLLYELWSYIAPALYRDEKNFAFRWLILSIVLFYSGLIFAYFVALPLMTHFFVSFTPNIVELKPDITQFLSFAISLFLSFALAFQIPILIIFLVKTNIAHLEILKKRRPYIIIGAFIVAIILIPSDIFSQTLLAIPLWLLFELGLFLARKF